jgi:NtrC-family two-component system response regulator AlgB
LSRQQLQDALAEASRRSFELAFVDLRLGTANGPITRIAVYTPWLRIIVTAYASIDTPGLGG